MADAKKCDRCGKYYTIKRKRDIGDGMYVNDTANVITVPQITYSEHTRIDPITFDVCYDCFEQFFDWFNEYHNKGEYIE